MNISLKNKHALVCGSSQGIGKAIAIELAHLGACITLLARNKDALQSTLKILPKENGQVHTFIVADLNQPRQLNQLVKQHLESVSHFNILVNNGAGIAKGNITEAGSEDFYQGITSHLISSQLLTQTLLPGMQQTQYGRIINILSTSVKQPIMGLGVANTIRGAIASWAKTLAAEVAAHGITVNNILPGSTDTKRLQTYYESKARRLNKPVAIIQSESIAEIPLKRFAQPQEIAWAVCYLASPAAAYITGINLPVDGGKLKGLC